MEVDELHGAFALDASSTCPSGKFKQQRIPVNGCGSQAKSAFQQFVTGTLKELPKKFHKCCNAHDRCYGRCHATQHECDSHFAKCLHGAANHFPDHEKQYYHGAATVVAGAVAAAGEAAFTAGQSKYCKCVGGSIKDPQTFRQVAMRTLRTGVRAVRNGLRRTGHQLEAVANRSEK